MMMKLSALSANKYSETKQVLLLLDVLCSKWWKHF